MSGIFENLSANFLGNTRTASNKNVKAGKVVDEIVTDYAGMVAEASADEFESLLFPSIRDVVSSRLEAEAEFDRRSDEHRMAMGQIHMALKKKAQAPSNKVAAAEGFDRRPHSECVGTSFMGYVFASYSQLVELFGEPEPPSNDGKVTAQWVVKSRYGITTIYDYKGDPDYRTKIDAIVSWHVGGRSSEVILGLEEVGLEHDRSRTYKAGRVRAKNSSKTAMLTPWGASHNVDHALGNDILWVDTPSHGGLAISSSFAEENLSREALNNGEFLAGYWFFEEDAAWSVAYVDSEAVAQAVNPLFPNMTLEHAKEVASRYYSDFAYLKGLPNYHSAQTANNTFTAVLDDEDEHQTATVMFRKFKDNGDIIAIFPDLPWSGYGDVTTYMHVGQHCGMNMGVLDEETVFATPTEYASLKAELEGIGYRFTVKTPDTPWYGTGGNTTYLHASAKTAGQWGGVGQSDAAYDAWGRAEDSGAAAGSTAFIDAFLDGFWAGDTGASGDSAAMSLVAIALQGGTMRGASVAVAPYIKQLAGEEAKKILAMSDEDYKNDGWFNPASRRKDVEDFLASLPKVKTAQSKNTVIFTAPDGSFTVLDIPLSNGVSVTRIDFADGGSLFVNKQGYTDADTGAVTEVSDYVDATIKMLGRSKTAQFEDAACAFPCGEEPMGCINCPDRGRTTPPKTKAEYMEMFSGMDEEEMAAYTDAEHFASKLAFFEYEVGDVVTFDASLGTAPMEGAVTDVMVGPDGYRQYVIQVGDKSWGVPDHQMLSLVKPAKEGSKRNAQTANPAKVGDILYSSWGYDQTNIDFYQVTRVTAASVELRPIGAHITESLGWMSDMVAPNPDSFAGEPFLRRVRANGDGKYAVSLNSYSSAWSWDGKPKNRTSYASKKTAGTSADYEGVAPFGWVIDEDLLYLPSDPYPSDVGKSNGEITDQSQMTMKFTLKDDDGETYYKGRMTPSCVDNYGMGAGNPLDDFGMPNAGCTSFMYGNGAIMRYASKTAQTSVNPYEVVVGDFVYAWTEDGNDLIVSGYVDSNNHGLINVAVETIGDIDNMKGEEYDKYISNRGDGFVEVIGNVCYLEVVDNPLLRKSSFDMKCPECGAKLIGDADGGAMCPACSYKPPKYLVDALQKDAQSEPNPKPKFNLGDMVEDINNPSMRGEVSFMGSYDEYIGGYRYKVLEPNGRRNYWNETSMRKISSKTAQKLITQEILNAVPKLYGQDGKGMDAIAYAKFFTPDGNWTWYMTEYNPVTGEAFGLVQGFETELGYFSIPELESVRGALGLPVERDAYFTPAPLSQCRTASKSAQTGMTPQNAKDWSNFPQAIIFFHAGTGTWVLGYKGIAPSQWHAPSDMLNDAYFIMSFATGRAAYEYAKSIGLEEPRELNISEVEKTASRRPLVARTLKPEQVTARRKPREAGFLSDAWNKIKAFISGLTNAVDELEKVVEDAGKVGRFQRKAQTDADPKTEAAIKEFLDLKKQISDLTKRRDEVKEELLPIFADADKQLVRAEGIVYTAIGKSTSTSWKPLFADALTKVNAQTKAVLLALQTEFTNSSDVFNLRPFKEK